MRVEGTPFRMILSFLKKKENHFLAITFLKQFQDPLLINYHTIFCFSL